jgi:hypothetical protein
MTAQETHHRQKGMQDTIEKNFIYKTQDDLLPP